jgi:ribosomal protein S18 acetylase RimI-like enzyme
MHHAAVMLPIMSKQPFRISPVRSTADVETTAGLFAAYARALAIDLSYQDFPAELAALPGKYAPPRGELLIARDLQGEPLGCVGVRPTEPHGCCEMKRLYVAPAARGVGLGKALVDAALEAAMRMGYREVRLDTLPSMSEAISIYRKAGFTPVAPYYDTPVAGTLFLSKSLKA